MTRIARYWRSQTLFLTLLFAALGMRALIPAGYMPALGHGLFALELCTAAQYQMPGAGMGAGHGGDGSGPATAHHDPYSPHAAPAAAHEHTTSAQHQYAPSSQATAESHHHNGAPTPTGHDSPCPFAATAVCAPAPVVVAHVAAVDASSVRASSEPQISTSSLLPRAQSARAPPALS